MPLVAGHDRGNHYPINQAYQKQLRLYLEFQGDVLSRIIPGDDQSALMPESDNYLLVIPHEGTYHQVGFYQSAVLMSSSAHS